MNAEQAERIYDAACAVLNECFAATRAAKHNPVRFRLENRQSLQAMLHKLDHRPKDITRSRGPRGIIFTLSVCQDIMGDDTNMNVSALRESIVDAIVYHRVHALGVDEALTIDAEPSSEGSAGDASSGSRSWDSRRHRRNRRRCDRSRSRSRSGSRSRSRSGDYRRRRDRDPERESGSERDDSRSRSPNTRRAQEAPPVQALPRAQQQQQQQHSRQQQLAAINAAIDPALAALLSPGDCAVYRVARRVLTGGVVGMSDAEKRQDWGAMCVLNPIGCLKPVVNAACSVIMGEPRIIEHVSQTDARFLETCVRSLLHDNPDVDRVCFTLRTLRRYAMLPSGAPLAAVLECDEGAVDANLRRAYRLLFSWEMKMKAPDGTRRVPTPWVAELCRITLSVLDTLVV